MKGKYRKYQFRIGDIDVTIELKSAGSVKRDGEAADTGYHVSRGVGLTYRDRRRLNSFNVKPKRDFCNAF